MALLCMLEYQSKTAGQKTCKQARLLMKAEKKYEKALDFFWCILSQFEHNCRVNSDRKKLKAGCGPEKISLRAGLWSLLSYSKGKNSALPRCQDHQRCLILKQSFKNIKDIIVKKQKRSFEYNSKNKINQDELIPSYHAGGDKDLMLFHKIMLKTCLIYS